MAACIQCGKPKQRTREAAKKQAGSTRMPKKLWLAELEADDFCSRECCEQWHGTNEDPAVRECESPKCPKSFPVRRDVPRQRFCSKRCSDDAKKARKFNVRGRCSGCGGEMEGFTTGCAHCADRRRSRLRREGEYKPSNPRATTYATEEERVAARRISWRDSKQRQRDRKAA